MVIGGLELVSARLEDLDDDVRPLQWWRKLVVIVVALDEA
jgi:hypothetical protein